MQQFLAMLKQTGLELDADEIADALWLATQIGQGETTEAQSEPLDTDPSPDRNLGTREQTLPPPLPEAPAIPPAQVSVSPPPPLPSSAPASTFRGASGSVIPFQAPAAPALRKSLELGRSLRPLMRKVPSRQVQILDEEATAIQIAESAGQRQWLPVFQPAPERWLDLALVVEETRSTIIWQELIAEFQTLVERQGAFRTIRTWTLQTDPHASATASNIGTGRAEQTSFQLFPETTGTIGLPRPRSYRELLDPGGRQLILVISDCISPAWRQGGIHAVLKQWSEAGPLAIVQLLPERLWNRSALGLGLPVQLSALLPGVVSSQLEVTNLLVWETVDLTKALTLPVVTLEPESLTQWAQVVAGMGKAQTAGMVFDLGFVQEAPGIAQPSTLREPAQRSPEALVQEFRATASPLARRLAGLMSLVPVSLPVIHLVQEAVLPASRQVHVAEIFMSGLLQVIPETRTDGSPEQYEFVDGVRERLRASVSKSEALTVLDQVSQYIAERAGLSIKSFAALLLANTLAEVEGTAVGAEVERFAELSVETLRRLGGEYAALVKEIEGRGSPQVDETTAYTALEQHLDYFQQEILDDFIQQEHQFELHFPGLRYKDALAEPEPEEITLAEGEEISVVILEHTLIDISEDLATFELNVRINFSVEISYPDHDQYVPELETFLSTYEITVHNQTVDGVAEVTLSFLEDEVEPELVDLTLQQPILINPNAQATSSVPFPPLQEFEFEVATIALELDSPSEDSDEIHAAAIAWFINQYIEVRAYTPAESEMDGALNRIALELGEHYDVLAPLLHQMKYAASRRDLTFRYQMVDASETTISGCVGVGHNLHLQSLLFQFDYNRATHTITGTLSSQPEIIQFFNGVWFARYVSQKIVHLLQEQGLRHSYLLDPVVGLPNGDRLELDLFFLVENEPLLIKCKTGKELRDAINQTSRFGTQLAIPSSQVFFIALDRTSEQLERYVSSPVERFAPPSLNLVLASRDTFLTEIRAVLETLTTSDASNAIALEPFEFEIVTIAQQNQSTAQPTSELDLDDFLRILEEKIVAQTGKGFNDLQRAVLKGSIQGLDYREIHRNLESTVGFDHLMRNVSPRLWKQLSGVTGEQITKDNLREPLKQWLHQQEREEPLIFERRRGQGQQFTEDLGNRVTLEMAQVPGGSFQMGSPEEELDRYDYESPQHLVTVPSFFIGKYPITQAQWQAIATLPQVNRPLEPDPSHFKGNGCPVENVSWLDAVEFCDRLSRHTGRPYRLPNEAEWEYACRGGTTTPFHFGETITTDLANYNGNYTYGQGSTTEVGSFPANSFGLYDMHGNVWEWCLDHWHRHYEGAPTDGSAWIDQNAGSNAARVLRGGSWNYPPRYCRSATRNDGDPANRFNVIGFRVVYQAPRTL